MEARSRERLRRLAGGLPESRRFRYAAAATFAGSDGDVATATAEDAAGQ